MDNECMSGRWTGGPRTAKRFSSCAATSPAQLWPTSACNTMQRHGPGSAEAEHPVARRHHAPGTPPLEFMQRLAARAIEERPSVARTAANSKNRLKGVGCRARRGLRKKKGA